MDVMEIVFIVVLCFVFLSAIATLIFLFQSTPNKKKRSIKKKDKLPDTNSGQIQTGSETKCKEIIPLNHIDIYRKLNMTLAQRNLVVLPNVRYSDMITIGIIPNKKEADKIYSQLPYLIADYVIFNYSDMKPLYIFNDVSKENNLLSNTLIMELIEEAKIKIINVDGFTNESISKIHL